MKDRDKCMAMYNSLYKRIILTHTDGYAICFYCGEVADSMDHQPPITRVDDYRSLRLLKEEYLLLSCCGECNRLVSDNMHSDIISRAEFITNKLSKRYLRKVSIPDWSQDDIAQMGDTMQREILSALRLKRRIAERLAFYKGITYYLYEMP